MAYGLYSKSNGYNVVVVDETTGNVITPLSTASNTTTSRLLSAAATTNGTSVKTTAGTIYGITLYNASGANKFLKFYNKASAPTVGTDVPILTYLLPPAATFFIDRSSGIYFSTGIAYAITGLAAEAATTAVAAADILCLNIEYA